MVTDTSDILSSASGPNTTWIMDTKKCAAPGVLCHCGLQGRTRRPSGISDESDHAYLSSGRNPHQLLIYVTLIQTPPDELVNC